MLPFTLGENFPSHNPKLEKEMLEKGVNRHLSKVESARKRDAETETAYGQQLLKAAIPPLVEGLVAWKKQNEKAPVAGNAYVKLKQLDNKVIAFIALKACLDQITQRRSFTSAAVRIGALIEDELHFAAFSQHPQWQGILLGAKRRPSYKKKRYYINKSHQGEAEKGTADEWERWGTRVKAHVGTVLIELIRKHTGLVDYVMIQQDKRGPTRFITPTTATLEWIEGMLAHTENLMPFWMPLLEHPKQWDNKWSGGYSTEQGLPSLPFIKTRNKTWLRENEQDLTEVYSAVNHLQNTPWKINQPVLSGLQELWDRGYELGGLPSREDVELPPFPQDETDEQAKRLWKQKAAQIYNYNSSTKSRRLLVLNTLSLANKFADKQFYLPHQTDFRGRCYAVPAYINHMGTDFQKGLLSFSRSETIATHEDAKWLAIHGANCYGVKGTFNQRIQWIEENRKYIHQLGKQPLSRVDMLEEADDPIQFMAFCEEWSRFMDTGLGFKTNLPCQMDASNNGLQLLGILMRDEISCYATNVIPTNYPQDIYQIVADKTIEFLKQDPDSDYADTWISFGVDRKTCKRPTMTQPYGSTPYSARKYVAEWYADKTKGMTDLPFLEEEKFQATAYLSRKVWDAIHAVVGKPQDAMAWLQDTAVRLADQGLPFYWVSPSGFPCYQNYTKWSNKAIKTKVGDKVMRVRFREDTDAISHRRQSNGASPNFIHSLDASILHKTVNRTAERYGINSFAMVHDSYGCHTTKCDSMASTIREVFVDVFTPDLLQQLKDTIEDRDGVSLAALPERGTLEVSNIINSEYIFA